MNKIAGYPKPDIYLQLRLLRFSSVAVFIVLVTGLLVLAGWEWDINFLIRPFPRSAAMNPVSAICFILTAGSFYLLGPMAGFRFAKTRRSGGNKFTGYVLALVVLLTGTVKIAEDIWYGSSQMSPNTAFCFILAGLSLLFLNVETAGKRMPAHYLSLIMAMMGLFSIVGFFYRVKAFYGVFSYIPMAVSSAICFLLISGSFLCANPGKGIMREFTGTFSGSLMARSLLPLVVLLPVMLGYLRLYGYWQGIFSMEFGVTILILSIIFIFTIIIWYNAQLLNKRDLLKKETEKTLAEKEEILRLLVGSVKDYAIFMVDPKGYVITWNEGAENIKGYKAEEIIGRHISCFYTEEETGRNEPDFNLTRTREKGRYENEGWRVRKDGTKFWANVIFTAIYDSKQQLRGFAKITRDITERKQLEEQILEFNEKLGEQVRLKTEELTDIFERITEAFFAMDNNFCFTYISKKAAALIRKDPAPLLGKYVWDVFPDAVGSPSYQAITRAMAEQVPIVNSDYYAPLDLWQENHIYPSPNGLSIFVRNITEQKKTEKKITDYKYAMDQSSIVAITDQKGIIKHVNDNFCKISKYSPDELIGQDHRIINSGYHPASFIRDLWATIAKGRIWKGELCNKAKDGTIYWVDTTIVPFLNEKGKPLEYLAIRADITERKKKEELLERSYLDIRQLASHLQDIREEERAGIAREIHDELGQQLTGLKMDLSWISKRTAAGEDKEIKQKIKDTLQLMDITIKTVRRIATDLRPSILDDLGLIAAMEWQSQEFQKRSGIAAHFSSTIVDFTPSSETAIGLFRICQESLTNVARHSSAKNVCISIGEQGKTHIYLKIEDDGKGFSLRKTGDKKTLGLLGMKERTLMMGGHFEMNSIPGKGTTLTVTVPQKNV